MPRRPYPAPGRRDPALSLPYGPRLLGEYAARIHDRRGRASAVGCSARFRRDHHAAQPDGRGIREERQPRGCGALLRQGAGGAPAFAARAGRRHAPRAADARQARAARDAGADRKPGGPVMDNRKRIRVGLQVVHRHRIGDRNFRRVSELVFLHGIPKLVLGWINFGGVRMPLYVELDRTKLRKARSLKNTYYYDDVTTDPRFEDMRPLPEPRRPA